MGYTQYYYQKKNITQKQWEKTCMKVFQVLDYCKRKRIRLNYECDVAEPPKVNDEMIRFNGWADDGHETFVFFKKKPDREAWQSPGEEYFYFCKTARKPYDLAVTLVLLVMAAEAPKSLRLASDGDWDVEDEWIPARKAYKELFGEDPACPFEKTANQI